MTPRLTIAYLSSRKNPNFAWFSNSLHNQCGGDYSWFDVIFVDHYAPKPEGESERFGYGTLDPEKQMLRFRVAPKPNVWNGPHRLTKEDWFNPANARNTALCLAPDGYIAYVDDLSVLGPKWLTTVRQAMGWNGITLGSYRKVKNLIVENGLVVSYDDYAQGHDSRWGIGRDDASVPCSGNLLFGCSMVAPVEALLTVGGWPEALCGGLGFEDTIMGIALQNAGFKFQYSRSMLTYESEEHHHLDPSFKRSDYGVSPNDKSHAVLGIVENGCRYFENCYEGGIRKMREEVLSGKPFPIVQNPRHEWFTGTPLEEL